jgi:spore maturation protein CgeB
MTSLGLNALFLQEGYDTEIFSPFGEKIDGDIVFIGSNYGDNMFPLSKERREMVETLKAHFGNKFQVYGNGWGWGRQVDQLEAAKIYRGAKIVINHSHFNLPRYTSNRMIFAMACGAFVISHDFSHSEIDWTANELQRWGNVSDLIPFCEAWLTQDKERNRIAHNGYIKVRDNYTFGHFVDNLIAIVP